MRPISKRLYIMSAWAQRRCPEVLAAGPEYPTLLYWQAYLLKDRDPEQSRTLLGKAGALSPYLVFPFREESIPVFTWAKSALPDNWKAAYYLSLNSLGKTRSDESLQEMADLGEKPDFAPFYISRGFLEKSKDIKKTTFDFEKALATDSRDWRSFHHLIGLYNETSQFEKALVLARRAARLFPRESVIAVDLARTFMNNKRYQDSYNILSKATILPYEGQRDVHSLYVSSQTCLALADMKAGRYVQAVKWLEASKEYPEHLGTGKPYNPDYRIQDTLQRFCYDKMKNVKLSEEARKRIQAYRGRAPQESPEVIEAKVDQWFKTTFVKEDERKALDELTLLIRGRRDERRRNP